jgi:thymidylate kinase
MKRFIIEGCDGTGKTTLAKKLIEKYGLEYVHCGTDDPSDYPFYSQSMRKANVVWDRHFIGEMVYPRFFNRKPKIGKYHFERLLKQAKELGVVILVLTATDEVLNSHNEDDIYETVRNNHKRINKKFMKVAEKYGIPTFSVFDYTDDEFMKIVETLEKIAYADKNK